MRIIIFLFAAICLSSCVSTVKFKRAGVVYNNRIDSLNNRIVEQTDSINFYVLMVERMRGANEALLLTQDKLQDRLALQEDELDDVRGNLDNTSSRMERELQQARAEVKAIEASRDSLLTAQQALVAKFEAGLAQAATKMDQAFVGVIPADKFRINISGGEVRLSVQESVLFEPKSVGRLADDAETVLRGVMDALQADPLLKLEVVGHTDNQPNPRRGASNWEYASLRANRIAEEMANVYYLSPNRVVAASQGEFGPLTSNSTEEGRATNRRVDFVLRNSISNLLRELDKLE